MASEIPEFFTQRRSRNTKQMRIAFLVAALIAALLWQTVWLRLRPPLAILLLGQVGTGLALLLRNRSLVKSAQLTLSEEQVFAVRLTTFEYACQLIGFASLGYEFWLATKSLPIATLIGVVYPLCTYWVFARPRLTKLKSATDQRR